jgi:NDP-sugar pyrophosphorylase family protein
MTNCNQNLSETYAAILVGGLGRRLQSIVNDRPKVMASINGRPFLTYILDQINDAGLKEVVLCVGYMGRYIESELGASYKNLVLHYAYEHEPLGTGGALRNAKDLLSSEYILVMNGDSYCQCNLKEFWSFHIKKKAIISILMTFVNDISRYGCISTDEQHRVLQFEEKCTMTGPGWINAGIYLMKRGVISAIEGEKFASLEKEIFPALTGKRLYGFMNKGVFLDIGTPEDFSKAGGFCRQL